WLAVEMRAGSRQCVSAKSERSALVKITIIMSKRASRRWLSAGFCVCSLFALPLTIVSQQPATPAPATAPAKPLDALMDQARKGDTAAQFKLGMAYLSGNG